MDIKKNETLAADIISLDKAINTNFHNLTLIYWILKKQSEGNPENTELKDKVLFLKSYLAQNITSYSQYNLSNDIVLLSNKASNEKDKEIQILKEIGLGKKEYLMYLKDPIYQRIHNLYIARETGIKNTYGSFLKTIHTTSAMTRALLKDYKAYEEDALNSVTNDETDKLINKNYKDGQSNIVVNKILCTKRKTSFIGMFEELMKKLWVKLDKNDNTELIVDMHFKFNEYTENVHSSGEESEYKYIKWWSSMPKLFYFVQQLLARQIIVAPQNDDIESLIVSHFYNSENNRLYTRKDVQDAQSNMLKNKYKKPAGFTEIDDLLKTLR